MAGRQWKSLGGLDREDAASTKRVLHSDYTDSGSTGSVSILYGLSGYWEQDAPYEKEGLSLLDIPQAGFITEAGAPMLVREGLFIAIPDNAQYVSVETETLSFENLTGKYDILPVPADALETEELVFEKNEDIYGSDEEYPARTVEYVETIEISGVQCVHLYVCPFKYRAKSGQLTALTEIEITVHYTGGESIDSSNRKISNPFYALRLLGYPQTKSHTDDAGKPRMLIVTTKELAYSLRILEGVKTFLYDVEIVYLETIKADHPGTDTVEAIHTYLLAEHSKKPINYVILGGGIDKIPSKMLNSSELGETIANDNYYCSFDDRSNPLPLFALGRLPVSTVAEMNQLVDYAAYYNRFYNGKRKTAVFSSYNDSSRGYEQCKRDISATLKGDFTIMECYDGKCSKEKMIEEINKGVGFINYRGHGDYDRWQSGNGLSIWDIPKLKVERNTPNVLSIACNNGGIHKSNCLGVEWVKQMKAISFLGASAPSYTYVNHKFDKYLWEGIHKEKLTKIGDIFVWATLELYRNDSGRLTVTNILEYLLLGDPSADYMDDKSDKKEDK